MSITLTGRARKLYAIAHRQAEAEAIEIIEAMLRVTRQEGIKLGVEQQEKYGHHIERKSA